MEVCIRLWQFYDRDYLNKGCFASYWRGLSATVPAGWTAAGENKLELVAR